MKNLLIVLTCMVFCKVKGQTTTKFDVSTWKAPYALDAPNDWRTERFSIPIDFAPQIPYNGVEDVRFTPGWGDVKSEEYWSYAFLWYLDGSPKSDAKIIESNLTAYYTGLIGRNIERRKIPTEKLFPVKASFKEVSAEKTDSKTYRGNVTMLDYMEQKPMVLNCIVHLKACSDQNKTFIFYEISPQPWAENVWKKLEQLSIDFRCAM